MELDHSTGGGEVITSTNAIIYYITIKKLEELKLLIYEHLTTIYILYIIMYTNIFLNISFLYMYMYTMFSECSKNIANTLNRLGILDTLLCTVF